MSTLERRTLGTDGPEVTALGFGAMELRGTPHRNPRDVDETTASAVLNTVLDEGVTFIDTSIDYALSEERIGRHIGHRRDEYVLATKAGCPLDHQPDAPPGPLVHDYSRASIRAGVEQSLRRLRTDRLDLVQLHISPSLEVLEQHGTLDELRLLRDEGKVLTYGISSTLPHLEDHLTLDELTAFQIPFSALERDHEAHIARAGELGFGVVVRGGIAQAGKRPKTTRDGEPITWAEAGLQDLVEDGETPESFLLRFTLSTPGVSTVIAGTADPAHVRANAAAARRGNLPADVHSEARSRLAARGLVPVPA